MSPKDRANIPQPRDAVGSPQLMRPDWTTSSARDKKLLWLDKNENLDPELAALNSFLVKEAIASSLNVYPDTAPLYIKLAAWVGVSPKNLILTPGSDGAIRAVFEAFISEGDTVLHTTPTFAMYSVYCKMYGVSEIVVEYEATSDGPAIPLSRLLGAIRDSRPRLVCLPNPDSPTGTVYDISSMKEIIEAAGEVGAVMLVDEAYHPFYEVTVAPLVETYPHLVVTRTFAKAWGLAGLRIGYAVMGREIAEYLHKVRPMYEVNTVSVVAVEHALNHMQKMMASVERLERGKRYFLEEMTKLSFPTLNGKGNFLHVMFGEFGPKIHDALSDIVLYRENFKDPCLIGYSRFSATTIELFTPVVERIKSVRSKM